MDQGFIFAAGAFGTYVLVVMAGLRVARRIEPALLVVASAIAVWLFSLAVLAIAGSEFNFWVFMAGYWFLATSMLMAFGAIYKSLSLRILMDLHAQPDRVDDYNRIFSRYLVQDSYENRLGVIRDKGFVELRAGRYELTSRGRRLANSVRTVQLWFGISGSG